MKKFRIFSFVLILCLVFSCAVPTAFALEEPDIQAAAAVLVDLDSGRILYAKNMDEARAPASLTKVMTVLLTLEAIDRGEASMDDMVTAQDDCRQGMDESSSTSGIMPGTVVSLRELLYCALLQSANEACNIIGTHLAGSISAFVDRMNAKAQELGCANTHFANPNGLTAENHYSSAYDLYLITRAAIEHPDFLTMCNTLSYQPESSGVNGGEEMHNSNALLTDRSVYGSNYLYEYASGVKTGYTRAAGYCLISTASKEDIHALAVVLGCDGALNAGLEEYRNFSSTISLYDWAFDGFSYQTVLSTAEQVQRVDVELAQDGRQAILRAQKDVTLLLPKDIDESAVTTSVTVYDDRLTAPIAAGTVLGEARILIDGEEYATVSLINSSNVELARAEYFKIQLAKVFSNRWVIGIAIAVLVFLIGYFALVIRYRRLRRRHLRQRKLAEKRRREQQMARDYNGRH